MFHTVYMDGDQKLAKSDRVAELHQQQYNTHQTMLAGLKRIKEEPCPACQQDPTTNHKYHKLMCPFCFMVGHYDSGAYQCDCMRKYQKQCLDLLRSF